MNRPDHLVLYLSGRCNLACPHCYARGVSKDTISAGALRSALAAFAAARRRAPGTDCGESRPVPARPGSPRFTILGGEPLLSRTVLRLALLEIRRLFGRGAPVHLFTNGLPLKKGEARALLARGVKLTVSMDGPAARRAAAAAKLPPALRARVSASVVATPASAGRLAAELAELSGLGFSSLAWSPDITARWDAAALRRLRASARELLLEYLRRLKTGLGVWELANGYEAVALAARGERPGPCRNLALAPDGFFYPCDKMLSGPAAQLKPFRCGPGGEGREKFFALARAAGMRASQSMCPAAPWAAARFG
ncbi:MAG: hypothetical protein FD189_228, partial [Elusimicrobia bacterium]